MTGHTAVVTGKEALFCSLPRHCASPKIEFIILRISQLLNLLFYTTVSFTLCAKPYGVRCNLFFNQQLGGQKVTY